MARHAYLLPAGVRKGARPEVRTQGCNSMLRGEVGGYLGAPRSRVEKLFEDTNTKVHILIQFHLVLSAWRLVLKELSLGKPLKARSPPNWDYERTFVKHKGKKNTKTNWKRIDTKFQNLFTQSKHHEQRTKQDTL